MVKWTGGDELGIKTNPIHLKYMKRLSRYIICLSCLLILIFPINAHEFWLMPSKYFASPGEVINLNFFVGEHFTGEHWGGGGRRINSLNYFHHGTVENITNSVEYKDSTLTASITLSKSGTHAIALSTNNAYIELEADKFNEYLKEDGLEHIIAWRAQQGKSNTKSREYYRRCAKTFIQVGSLKDHGYKGASAMVLEIIARENPYRQKPGTSLHFQVLYKNKPLENGLVRMWYRDPEGKVKEEQVRTDSNGLVRLAMKKKGEYMISIVWMEPWTEDNKAELISTWSSLTFAR